MIKRIHLEPFIFLLILIIAVYFMDQNYLDECGEENKFYKYNFSGVIISKFKDTKNHYVRTIIVKGINKIDTVEFVNEISRIYSSISTGDTILKMKNELIFFRAQRGLWIPVDTLNCGCPE
ncbi:MAG TPA: hypothetical protein PKY12_05445 [Catalimonadaceae bacterium]|nr:hypothetical protein [Catalimonadaceae bacterium]